MEAENYPREKKKLMNIAQKMLKFQAETSLFLMRKTKQNRERGENGKMKRKIEKKGKWRSQKVQIRMWR